MLKEIKQEYGQYLALSYCWGDSHRALTTTLNYELYQQSIPLDQLPQTFQDAIVVTQKLGFAYLWIDALCIIQDSAEDKDKELALMANVYRNATITISAAKGDNADAGLFANRDARWYRPCLLPMSRPETLYPFYVVWPTLFRTALPGEWNDKTVLDSRAWVLQEALLSTRMLIFGHRCLSWSCASSKATELQPFGTGNAYHLTSFDVFRRLLHGPPSTQDWGYSQLNYPSMAHLADFEVRKRPRGRRLDYNRDVCEGQIYWRHWYGIIEDYTTRSMTHIQDKLPALSGLASAMSSSSCSLKILPLI